MEELLDKTEKRSLLFLRTLYGEERWWTEQELSAIGNCSANATYYTLNLLKEEGFQQSGNFNILSKKSKGYFLETAHDQISIGEIESLFIRQTLSFKLIDAIFHHPSWAIDDLAESLLFSKSTIYRQSRRLALYFEKNGLSLNTHNFVLSGPELLIRGFFYRFYWFFIKSKQWPFKQISYSEVSTRYIKLTSPDLSFNRLERIQFFYRYAINHTRHQQQAFLTDELDWNQMDPHVEFYTNLLQPFIGSHVPKECQLNEGRFLTLALISCNFFQDYQDDFEEKIKWYKEQNTLSYQFSANLLQTFKELNPTAEVEDDAVLIYKLICIHLKMTYFSQLIIRHSNINNFLDTLLKENPLFYEELHLALSRSKKYLTDAPNDDNFDYLLYYILLIFSAGVDIDDLDTDITIKLICAAEPLSQRYLQQKLLKRTDQTITVHTTQYENTDRNKESYDIILSDIQIESSDDESETLYYIWDFPPTERDWKNIYNLIDSIQ